MAVKSRLNYLRISPRKVRLIADIIRKKKVEDAQSILSFTPKKGAGPLLKLLNSAVASAKNNFQLDGSNLYICKITVDEGPKYKRWRARSRGMASPIQKKTSHVTIVLDEVVKNLPKKGKKIKKKEIEPKKIEPEEIKKPEEAKPKSEKPLRPKSMRTEKPKEARGIKKFFRRKSV